ncbi:MAG: hypothetical protein HS111_29305 [Kofleriaceae bacterium]|nr:hypothetical protein [Kofleriaceae bacterium]
MLAFDTPWLSLGRLLANGVGKHRHHARDGRGLSAFDTPSLALGRLRPTGWRGLAVRFPQFAI